MGRGSTEGAEPPKPTSQFESWLQYFLMCDLGKLLYLSALLYFRLQNMNSNVPTTYGGHELLHQTFRTVPGTQ